MGTTRKTPIDALLDRVAFRCTRCDAPAGTCACWVKCACGWSYEKGDTCRNPVHTEAKEPTP